MINFLLHKYFLPPNFRHSKSSIAFSQTAPRHADFAQMQGILLSGASELLPKHQNEAKAALEKLLPNTERLPERREDWDEDYQPDEWRTAPENSSTWPRSRSTRLARPYRRGSGAADSPPQPAFGQNETGEL